MKKIVLCGMLLLACGAAGAEEQVVLGASVFDARHQHEVDDSIGYGVFADYRFDTVPAWLEYRYTDTGKAEITVFPGALRFSGSVVSAAWAPFQDASSPTLFWLRGGYYKGESEFKFFGGTLALNSSGAMYGVGMDWMATSSIGVRVALERLAKVKDFRTGSDSTSDIDLLSVGLLWAWPGHGGAAPSRAPACPVMPACPAAAAAPAPAITPPAGPAVGKLAHLKAGAVAHSRPAADAAAIALPEKSLVSLRESARAGETVWWYVAAGTAAGWVAETDLEFATAPAGPHAHLGKGAAVRAQPNSRVDRVLVEAGADVVVGERRLGTDGYWRYVTEADPPNRSGWVLESELEGLPATP